MTNVCEAYETQEACLKAPRPETPQHESIIGPRTQQKAKELEILLNVHEFQDDEDSY